MFHVGSDLMGTSGFQPAFHECDIIEILQYAVVGDGMFPDFAVRREDCHLHPVFRVAGDVAFDTSFFLLKVSPDQGIVQSFGGFVEELFAQMRFGVGIFGHHEKSGGVLVYAVYQSHGRVVRVIVRIVFQMPGDGIDQRAGIISASGMHHQSRRFVHHHQVFVFVHDVEGNVFRDDFIFIFRPVQENDDFIERFHFIAAFHRPAVYEDELLLGSPLQPVARRIV